MKKGLMLLLAGCITLLPACCGWWRNRCNRDCERPRHECVEREEVGSCRRVRHSEEPKTKRVVRSERVMNNNY